MAGIQIHRLLRLITLLQSGEGMTVQQLMEQLGVSRRTVYRDMNRLEEAGVPYYHTANKGYRIARNFFLPPISLTVPEILGLMLMAKNANAQRRKPMMDHAYGAIMKLTATVPEPLRDACSELMQNVTVNPAAQTFDDRERYVYATLQQCIDEGRACRIDYRRPLEDVGQSLHVEPYALHFCARAWYVMAHTPEFDQVRTFKLARIASCEILKRKFTKPRNFSVDKKLGKAWQLIPEGTVYKIDLEFGPKVGTNVSEVRWHASQQQKMLADGRCRMQFEVDGLSEIAWWLCGYADQVRIIKPAALRKRVYALTAGAAKVHKKG